MFSAGRSRKLKNVRGFTLLEVLVSLFILAGAMLVIGNSWSGNFMRIRKTALFNNAATLLERKMAETEAKYKDKPPSEIPAEEEGDFGNDYPQYRWVVKSQDLELPDLTPLLVGQEEEGANEMLITMLKQVTEYLSKAIKEVKVSVFVNRSGKDVEFAATQYFVDYSKDFAGGAGGAAPDPAAPVDDTGADPDAVDTGGGGP